MKKQAGFTLIELVVVLVILGILAAIAVPKYVDMSTEAKTAATKGVAGSISSAAAINYAAYSSSNKTKGAAFNAAAPCTKAALDTILATGLDTNQFDIANGTPAVDCSTAAAGTSGTCTITYKGSSPAITADATVICAK